MQEGGFTVGEALARFDCAARTSTLLHVTAFGPDGTQLAEGDLPAEQPQREEDAMDTALLDLVCVL